MGEEVNHKVSKFCLDKRKRIEIEGKMSKEERKMPESDRWDERGFPGKSKGEREFWSTVAVHVERI